MLQQTWRKTILRDTKLPFLEQNKLMQQTRGKHSMFWWYASTKQGKRAIQNARVCAIWIIYALESATRFDRVGVLSSQAAQRRETERFVRSLADDEGFCLPQASSAILFPPFCFCERGGVGTQATITHLHTWRQDGRHNKFPL